MLTVNPSELHGMLTDLQRTAGSDWTMPMLDGVLLYAASSDDGRVLVGTSTNRFVLGHAIAPATGDLPETFIPNVQVKQLLSALKNYSRTPDLLCELIPGDGLLTMKLPGDVVLPAMTVTVKLGDKVNFPQVANIFTRDIEPGEGTISFNPRYMAAFCAIARRRNEDLRIELSHADKKHAGSPSRIFIGESYKGIFMPIRQQGEKFAPTYLPPSQQRKEPAKAEQPAA